MLPEMLSSCLLFIMSPAEFSPLMERFLCETWMFSLSWNFLFMMGRLVNSVFSLVGMFVFMLETLEEIGLWPRSIGFSFDLVL